MASAIEALGHEFAGPLHKEAVSDDKRIDCQKAGETGDEFAALRPETTRYYDQSCILKTQLKC